MVLGRNVRWLRHRQGLSQEALAAKVRLRHKRTTHSYISRIELGQIDPPVSFVSSLARALHVRPWFLLADMQDSLDFFEIYLRLSASKKGEVQVYIKNCERRTW